MKAAAAIIGAAAVLLVSCAQPIEAGHIWKEVPDHRGVFVDMASIVHVDVSRIAYRHCMPDGPPDSCDPPPFDTKADIKVGDAISTGLGFWCSTPDTEMGDVRFGKVGGEEHIIPTAAIKPIVCGSSK
ncbi:MAG TPA: hypothetical protein VHW02_03110 [Rhizomicrobium sp.]|jgi:hypothetical protein|nr:hypothetical protein [Rhizomicrobium sp.]